MTIALDRTDLVDLPRPDQLVTEILRQNPGLKPPIPIWEICAAAGITEVKSFTSAGFEGMLLADEEKYQGVICYNKNSRPQRQRFTVAHELGHFLLPTHKDAKFMCSSEDMRSWSAVQSAIRAGWEVQANQFAAQMLMPEKLTRAFLRPMEDPELAHVERLAEAFETSREAAARRLVELSDYPCALLVCMDNLVRYSVRSEFFPWWVDLKPGARLPKGSTAATHNEDGTSDMEEAANEHWLAFRKGESEPSALYEQVVAKGPYKLVLLTAVE